jgi:hypothetical protein
MKTYFDEDLILNVTAETIEEGMALRFWLNMEPKDNWQEKIIVDLNPFHAIKGESE